MAWPNEPGHGQEQRSFSGTGVLERPPQKEEVIEKLLAKEEVMKEASLKRGGYCCARRSRSKEEVFRDENMVH